MKLRKYQFKSNAGPHYHSNGVCYEPGDTIELSRQEAEGLLFKLVPLFKEPEPAPEPEPKVKLKIIGLGSGGYDVVNEVSGDCINDAPLKLRQAQILAGEDAEIFEVAMPEITEEETVDPAPLKAKHKGGGKYNIIWEETEVPIVSKLFTKSETRRIIRKISDGSMTIKDLV